MAEGNRVPALRRQGESMKEETYIRIRLFGDGGYVITRMGYASGREWEEVSVHGLEQYRLLQWAERELERAKDRER